MRHDLKISGQPIVAWFDAPSEAALLHALQASSALAALERVQGQEGPPPAPGAAAETAARPAAERINPTSRVLRFIVPVSDGQTYLGDVQLAVSPQDALSVDAPRMLELLEPLLRPEAHQRLAAAAPAGAMLDEAMLQQAGITLAYDPRSLSLRLAIAVENRVTRGLSMRTARGRQAVTLQPAGVSGYMNVRAAAEIVQAGGGDTFVPPLAAIDLGLRVAGVVLENESVVSARSGDPRHRRVGSRLLYDDLAHQLRIVAGDTQVFPTRFQASPSAAGIGISRIYGQLDPQREIRASGSQSFSVTSPSTIETFVNGRSVERRTFQPGNYTLADFPLAEGANQVRLRIEEESGKVREVDISLYANQALLARGISEFALFGGVYSTPTRTGFAYSRAPFASGFIRAGLTEQFTAGFNIQANEHAQQAGVEGLWGSPIGLTGFALSASHGSGRRTGYAAAMTYELVLSSRDGGAGQSFRASAEMRSRDFIVPQLEFYQEPVKLRASAGAVFSLGGSAFVAADGFYDQQWTIAPATRGERRYGARLTGGFDLTPRISPTAEFGIERGSGRRETFLRVGVRLRLGERGTAQLDADTRGAARASVSTAGGSGNGAWLVGGDIGRDRENVSLNAVGSLLTNRAELGVQQSASWNTRSNDLASARTAVRAGFALAFADGAFALGRPVSEAFLIAGPHRSLEGKAIYLDPNGESEIARSGGLGPALHGQLSAHNFRTLLYQVPEAPSGYDLGAGNVSIEPPYRGGYRLVVGSDYHLLVLGRLLGADGQPVSLLAGKAIDLGDPKHPAITIFTSRDGRFGAQGLRPGRWRFEMPTEPPTIYEFTVADSADGTVRMGDMRPVGEPK